MINYRRSKLATNLFSKIYKCFFILLLFYGGIQPYNVYAQSGGSSDKPVYIVQPGDTLSSIALQFGVSLTDLEAANGITNPNQVAAGTQLVIPGLSGVHGILTTETVTIGDTLTSLSRLQQVPIDMLVQLNHLTSPNELFIGSSLVIPKLSDNSVTLASQVLSPGQSLLTAAVMSGSDPWTLTQMNQLAGTWDAIPGEPLAITGKKDQQSNPVASISPLIQKIDISPLPVVQGKTTEIKITTTGPLTLEGSLAGNPLNFFQNGPNQYVSLQGLYAMANPGLYPLQLSGKADNGTAFSYGQMVQMVSGNYPQDPPLVVDPVTLDPTVTGPEDSLMASLTKSATPDRLWNDVFRLPVDQPICIKSWFGDRRSYNGGPFIYFHTGIDYGVCANLNIYAAASGVVVYTGLLTVRGNATVINHGWGVYSAYYHQKEFLVKVGDQVKAGQQIGVIGATGRVNGPHVHFEVWVNGIQVDPQDWQAKVFP